MVDKWQKGGPSPNPSGRPKTPAHIQKAMRLNRVAVAELLDKYMWATTDELKVAWADPKTPAIERAVIKIIEQAMQKGDSARLESLLQRAIGKVEDRLQVTRGFREELDDLMAQYRGDRVLPQPTEPTVIEAKEKTDDEDK